MSEMWYVARTQTGSARCAVNNLEYQRFEVFWPQYQKERVLRGQRIEVSYPVFPGYIFLRLDINDTRWRATNYTLGVIHLLPLHLEIPIPLPEGFVERLKTHIDIDGIKETLTLFTKDQLVRLVAGPFAMYQARVVNCQKKSAQVLISSFAGRETLLTVDTEHLEAVPLEQVGAAELT